MWTRENLWIFPLTILIIALGAPTTVLAQNPCAGADATARAACKEYLEHQKMLALCSKSPAAPGCSEFLKKEAAKGSKQRPEQPAKSVGKAPAGNPQDKGGGPGTKNGVAMKESTAMKESSAMKESAEMKESSARKGMILLDQPGSGAGAGPHVQPGALPGTGRAGPSPR
jgi:hypothetical protein